MTSITIIEFIIIWLFIANFICRKRNWYQSQYGDDRHIAVIFAFVLMPIFLIITIIREFIVRDWDN